MALIVEGKMPTCCGLCPCFHAETPMHCQADKTIRMTAPYGKRMEGCPLVELPPHGRLIDAEEAIDNWDAVMMVIDRYSMCQFLNRIPTVLEASDE